MDAVEKLHMEMIDVITPAGVQTGRSLSREAIHKNGTWHRTVHVWVVDEKGRRVLLQKRAAQKDAHPGMWDVSCAGHIESGHTSLRTAVRELEEELGLAVKAENLHRLCTIPSQFKLQDGRFVDNELVDVYLLKKEVACSDLALQAAEVETVQQVLLSDLEKRVLLGDPRLVPHTGSYTVLFQHFQNR